MSTFATDIKNGDGSTVVFTLSFSFLSRDDVTVSRLENTQPDTDTGTVLTSSRQERQLAMSSDGKTTARFRSALLQQQAKS